MSHCRCGSCASCGGWCGVRCQPYDVYNGIPVQDLPPEPPLTTSDQTQFDWFRSLLDEAVQSEGFQGANAVMRDPAYLAEVRARIWALSDSFSLDLSTDDIALSSPSIVTVDESTRTLRFRGTSYPRVLALPDTTVYRPRYIALRPATVAVPEPTLLADESTGVWLLDSNGTATRRIDGWNQGSVSGGYGSVTSLATWEGPSDPIVAMVMPLHHCIRLFNLRTSALISTLGLWNSPGGGAGLLQTPSGAAYHNGLLFISCSEGQPTQLINGDVITPTGEGFLAVYDVSTPASPVMLGVLAACTSNGSMLRGEVQDPRGLFVQNNTLWATNGTPAEAAAWPLPLPASTPLPLVPSTRFYAEDSFPEIKWTNLGPPAVRDLTDNPTVLCIPDQGTGYLVTIRLDRNAVRALYRTRWTRDEFKAPDALPTTSTPACAIPDRRSIGGVMQDVLWVCDTQRGVVMNVLDPQDTKYYPSRVLYRTRTFSVPTRLTGYALTGRIPTDRLRVSYKHGLDTQWRDLNPQDSTEPMDEVTVRLTVQLPYGDVGEGYTVEGLRLLCETV